MPTKKKPVSSPKPQFVTEVVEEELPVNEGVDVPPETLETIKEKAEEIEEVVEEIQQENRPHENDVLEEIFSKDASSDLLPDITKHRKGKPGSSVFLWSVIVISVALLTGGGLLLLARGLPRVPSLFVGQAPTPTQTPALEPTPTLMPTSAQRSDISLQVLNGGGTKGSAGKGKTFLEEKGYTVSDVGNTEEYTYETTEIHVKPGKEEYLELLKEDLTQDYTIGSAVADLPADSPYDAQVIVGKE